MTIIENTVEISYIIYPYIILISIYIYNQKLNVLKTKPTIINLRLQEKT